MIKGNTKVLFIMKWHQIARAGTCATERNQNRATRASNPEWELWYRMAVQARKSRKLHHRGVMKFRRKQEQGDLRSYDLRPLGRYAGSIRNRASGLARNDLQPLGRHDRNLRNKVFLSGHGTSRCSRQW